MKNFLLFSLCICLFAGLQAQEQTKKDQNLAKIKEQKLLKFKVASDTTFRLDSTLSFPWNSISSGWDIQPNSRSTSTYDTHGNSTGYRISNWNSIQNKWICQEEYLYVFDNNGNMTEWIWNNWDTLSNSWIPFENDTLWYNSSNILTSDKWYYYNTQNSSWVLGFSEEYNDAGGPLNVYYYYWNDVTFMIEGGERELYTLNAFNIPAEVLVADLDTATGNWLPSQQLFYDYTNDTVLVKQTGNYWNGTDYVLSYQNLYSYTGGLLTESLTQNWDGTGLTWINSRRTQYSYNSDKLQTEYLYQKWVDNLWKTSTERSNVYDSAGNNLDRISKSYSTSTGLITSGYHYMYTYLAHNVRISGIFQHWDLDIADWINSSKSLFYYSPLYGIHDIGESSVLCKFENPYQTGYPIVCPALKASENYRMSVYSMSGARVFQNTFNGGAAVSIDKPLANGLYMLVILDGKGIVYSNKVLISN